METLAADQIEVVYFTDPLCCWSWAMEPQWQRFRSEFQKHVRWRYCMSGLLPSWGRFHDHAHSISRPAQMGPLWMEASHLSGMTINSSIWALNPPSSSYPACIAVKCAEMQSAEAGENYLRRLREAVMIDGKNIADLSVLTVLASELELFLPGNFDAQRFANDMQSTQSIDLFRKDLEEVRIKNIRRFPSLLFKRQGTAPLMLSGYRPYEVWIELMQKLAPDLKPDACTTGT